METGKVCINRTTILSVVDMLTSYYSNDGDNIVDNVVLLTSLTLFMLVSRTLLKLASST